MSKDETNIKEMLDDIGIATHTKAGAEFSLFGRVSLLAERANKACSGQGCLCEQNDTDSGSHHSCFCPLYKAPRR